MKTFLTANWKNLIMINYRVPPDLLQKYVPAGTELDDWNGKVFVSLVAFQFLNTKVLGVKIPFIGNFEEINLRFYVRYNENGKMKRGVVFVKELVPHKIIASLANLFYKEHYDTALCTHDQILTSEERTHTYHWKYNKTKGSLTVIAVNLPIEMEENTLEEFIAEHYWGYTKINNHKTAEYEVTHPKWRIFPVVRSNFSIDFEKMYGNDFKILNDLQPESVFCAEGSTIEVRNKKVIRVNNLPIT